MEDAKVANMEMLKDFLDWDRIMKAKRYSGGHSDVMDVLFINGIVLGSVSSDDYQGNIGYAYLVYGWTNTAKIVLISDSYGSCSGCDQWEDAGDEDVRQLCTNLANDAHSFDSIEEAIAWLYKAAADGTYYEWRELGTQLASELTEKLAEIKAKGL